MKTKFSTALSLAMILSLLIGIVPALAYSNTATFTGQGFIADGFGGYDLATELCGIANGADTDGPYLLFVLTATGAKNANITFPSGTNAGTQEMTKFGNGTFKYIALWDDPDALMAAGITATYDGKPKNAQLVISHGCRPFTNGAWCSPGFWGRATVGATYNDKTGALKGPGAWSLVAPTYTPDSLFNNTVYDYWYGATFAADPTLMTVLTNANTYSGPPYAGTSGYALNAFNATGAMLTDAIPGFDFDFDLLVAADDEETSTEMCPIDHFGNFK